MGRMHEGGKAWLRKYCLVDYTESVFFLQHTTAGFHDETQEQYLSKYIFSKYIFLNSNEYYKYIPSLPK